MLNEMHHIGSLAGVALTSEDDVLRLLVVEHVLVGAVGYRVYVWRVIRARLILVLGVKL